MTQNVQKYIIYTLCILFIVSIFLMNSYVPFFSDDMHCTYFGSKNISSLSDIIQLLRYDYIECNGRIIPNLLVMLTVKAGEKTFNVINTLLTFTAVIMLWKTISIKHESCKLLSFLVLIILFLSLSTGIDSLYYWAAGASNYVWTLIPTLVFIMLMGEKFTTSINNALILFLIGCFSGLQHEMYACPIAAAFWTLIIFSRKGKLPISHYSLIIGFTLGMAVVVMAPGNYSRGDAYTFGLGALSRIIKMLYSLRIFYILIILGVISFIKNKERTKNFIRQNALYILIIAYSFVIPFLAATASRAMYTTEIFSLILLIRLIDTCFSPSATIRYSLCTCLVVFLFWFQGAIVQASGEKWSIYKQTVNAYYHQSSNTVVMNDVQCSNPLIEYYTVNMNNILMPSDKSMQLALEKRRLNGKNAEIDDINDNELIKVIPTNIDTSAKGIRIQSVGFINHPQMRYYIMPWKEGILDKINQGRFYALYSIPVINRKLKINYLSNDVQFERAAYEITYKGRRYILLNKKYKHYPFIKLQYMGFNKEAGKKKIEIQ